MAISNRLLLLLHLPQWPRRDDRETLGAGRQVLHRLRHLLLDLLGHGAAAHAGQLRAGQVRLRQLHALDVLLRECHTRASGTTQGLQHYLLVLKIMRSSHTASVCSLSSMPTRHAPSGACAQHTPDAGLTSESFHTLARSLCANAAQSTAGSLLCEYFMTEPGAGREIKQSYRATGRARGAPARPPGTGRT